MWCRSASYVISIGKPYIQLIMHREPSIRAHPLPYSEHYIDVFGDAFMACNRWCSFKTEKSTKLKKIMLSFVTLQADYHKTVEKAWINLVPRLQAGDGSVAAHTSSEASITDTTTTATSNKPPLDKEEVAAIKPRHPIAVMKASPVYMQMLIVGALSVGAMVLSSRVGRR